MIPSIEGLTTLHTEVYIYIYMCVYIWGTWDPERPFLVVEGVIYIYIYMYTYVYCISGALAFGVVNCTVAKWSEPGPWPPWGSKEPKVGLVFIHWAP